MKVNFAHLCDYAIVSQDGKLSVLGIFDNIGVMALPAVHPRLVLAFQLEPHASEVGSTFELAVHCVDQDGRKLFDVEGSIRTGVAEGATIRPGDQLNLNQIIEIGGLSLQRPGPHEVNIIVNGERRGGVRFEVRVIPAPPKS